ncbi:MAG: endonuclease III [Patescibacteria group bacterium]
MKKYSRASKKTTSPSLLKLLARNPYKTLISTLLSSRTKDEVTLDASKKLFNKAPTINKLGQLNQLEIRNLIYPVGFYKTKARQLIKLAELTINQFDGKIPNNREDLVKLPGVGRKTANLVLNRAFGKPAIAVDTHVHKISNILGWVKTKTPEQTEKELTKILPKKYWSDINRLFVSVGRQFTTKKRLKEYLIKEGLTS